MKYKNLDGIKNPLSALVYGTPGPAFAGNCEVAFKSYDYAWEAGFRIFDTAHLYREGERVLGEWIESRGHRSEIVILDKGCNPCAKGSEDVFSASTIREQIELSLKRLKTDCVELYILHRDDDDLPVDPIMEELNKLKQEGKVIRLGASNWTFKRIMEANRFAKENGMEGFTVVSPQYSLVDYNNDIWGHSISLSGEAQKAYRDWLTETQTPTFCYSSLARGYLSGKFKPSSSKPIEECIADWPIQEYDCPKNRKRLAKAEKLANERGLTIPQVALAWMLKQPMNLFPIVVPSSQEHINEIARSVDVELSDEECVWLTADDVD